MASKLRSYCKRYCHNISIFTILFLILLFLTLFIIVPVAFKYSAKFQTSIIFPAGNVETRINFSDFSSFAIKGGRNLYIQVNTKPNITLGVWHLLPHNLTNNNTENNFEELLYNSSYSVLIYLHGNNKYRCNNLEIYTVLRNFFHIIACDYRAYGDSTQANLNADGIVSDVVALYEWLLDKTQSQIYIWGHSLGTGIGTQAAAVISNKKLPLTGLILETPFTDVVDVIKQSTLGKVFSWLPWFDYTIINPLRDNGMIFNSTFYIQQINCPVLILHAKDDTTISYKLANRLYDVAKNNRSLKAGKISYILFEAVGYGHLHIHKVGNLTAYINDFLEDCDNYNLKQIS